MNAELIFPETHRLDGFTSSVTSHRGAEADPVIRELLQNSLDAAVREAGRKRAEVHFTISRPPLAELPGLREYRRAFSAAAKERRGRAAGLTHDEDSAIKRIQRVLDARKMYVLFCRDNGVGLDADGLRALLSEGNSTKPSVGAGSYGLGHQTAYAASDLRYVLYGGQRGGRELVSGHAILATHRDGHTRRDADGYYWFIGRSDDVINTAGHLVGPFEVESALIEHPAVAEAGVIGKPDPIAMEVVKAFVSLKEGFEPSDELRRELMGFARGKLAAAVAPREIEIIDGLPKTRSGKIMRRLLKARDLGLDEGDTSTLAAA